MDIKAFVRQVCIHGVPYAEASKYDASVRPTLLEMLDDPKEQDHWPNIVITLGMIDDQNAVEPMIAFVEKARKCTSSLDQRKAMTSAVVSLGYLINRSGSRRALDYPTTLTRDKDLKKYAVMGLALSGHPKAAEKLKSIPKESAPIRGKTALSASPRPEFRAIVRETPNTKEAITDEVINEAAS